MASSSIDSLSPGSEGAGAISVREVCVKFYPLCEGNAPVVNDFLPHEFAHHLNLFSSLQIMSITESHGDGSKGSSIRRKHQDGSGHQDSAQSIPSTPDRCCTKLN